MRIFITNCSHDCGKEEASMMTLYIILLNFSSTLTSCVTSLLKILRWSTNHVPCSMRNLNSWRFPTHRFVSDFAIYNSSSLFYNFFSEFYLLTKYFTSSERHSWIILTSFHCITLHSSSVVLSSLVPSRASINPCWTSTSCTMHWHTLKFPLP